MPEEMNKPRKMLDDIRAEISHKIKLCSEKRMSYGMEVALAIIDKHTERTEDGKDNNLQYNKMLEEYRKDGSFTEYVQKCMKT